MVSGRKFAGIVLSLTLYILAFDVVGVVVSTLLDIYPARRKSSAAFWAIWFVLAVFCGFIHYMSAGQRLTGVNDLDWTRREDARNVGRAIVVGSVLTCILAAAIGYLAFWRFGADGSYYVPDNMALSIMFLATVALASVVAHATLLPNKPKVPEA